MTIARTARRRPLAALDWPGSQAGACASALITAAVTQPDIPDQVARERLSHRSTHAGRPVGAQSPSFATRPSTSLGMHSP